MLVADDDDDDIILLAENLKFTSNSISHNNWSY